LSYLHFVIQGIQRTVQDSQEAKLKAEDDLAEMERIHPLDLAAAEIGLKEKEKTLEDLKAGPDELDIRAKRIALRQKEDALVLAKQNLAYCNVFAPFDGVVTEVKIKKNDSVSAGQVLATLITKQKIAEITLNEVDIAKVKIGQKANITFDALEDLNITGEVKEVNTLGTATQGVVTYGVKIVFDTDADYAKPGMSITANIITEAKQDVLVLPNSAIKSQGESYYVELVEAPDETKQQLLANVSGIALPTSPKMLAIEIGLSNDLSTEIVSGLEEGDVVVSSTVNQSNNQTSQSQRNREFGMPGMGGGAMFIR
jgi:HlyD family secretion protein